MKQKTRMISHMLVKNEGKILLLRRNSDDLDNPGSWELPGGAVEFGEHPKETAKRELKEETGIEVKNSDLKYLMSYTYEKPEKEIHLLRFFYICEVKSKSEIKLDPDEHNDYLWVNEREVINFPFPDYMEKAWKELINNDKSE